MMSCMVCKTMQSLFFSKCFVKSLIHHKIETVIMIMLYLR
jgi:hypothetical protein